MLPDTPIKKVNNSEWLFPQNWNVLFWSVKGGFKGPQASESHMAREACEDLQGHCPKFYKPSATARERRLPVWAAASYMESDSFAASPLCWSGLFCDAGIWVFYVLVGNPKNYFFFSNLVLCEMISLFCCWCNIWQFIHVSPEKVMAQ